VDGTARAQMVTPETNEKLHRLLTTFAERHGVGILCNTSLNFKGCGFINRMSDLVRYCEGRGVSDLVVGAAWFPDSNAGPASPREARTGPDPVTLDVVDPELVPRSAV